MTEIVKPTAADVNSDRPLQNSAIALRFLNLLGRNEFEFRIIPDSKRLKDAQAQPIRRFGTLAELKYELRSYNNKEYGIFVQVNPADGSGFTAKNIIGAPCFFVDLDGVPLENLDRIGLRPHMIVQTSPGKYHAYWRVDGIPLDQFKPFQRRLARLIESDKSVIDLPRLMRLPGFCHMKTGEGVLVEIIEENDQPAFAFDALAAALAAAELRAGIGKKVARKSRGKQPHDTPTREIERAKSAIHFLLEKGAIDIGVYDDWLKLAFALKHSFGEAGWDFWHELSASADNYDGEEACRTKWDSIGEATGSPLTVASFFSHATELGWTYDEGTHGGHGPGRDDDDPHPAVVIKNLALNAGDEFWREKSGRLMVSFNTNGPGGAPLRLNAPLQSKVYRDSIGDRYHRTFPNRAMGKETLEKALMLLNHAARTGPMLEAHLRSGMHEGALYVSLGREDGAVVRVTSAGWDLVDECPIKFLYRGDGSGELPVPEKGGSLDLLRQHISLSDADVIRVVGFMLTAFVGAPAYPILLCEGEQGTFKSTFCDMVLSLTDPVSDRKQGRSSFSADERSLYVRANHAHVLFFDNISNVDAQTADSLCRLATGGSVSGRALYTDGDEVTLSALRPVVITCIGGPTQRGDFVDRTVVVTTLPGGQRRTEASVWAAFEQDRGKLFGFLLDLAQECLANRDEVTAMIERGALIVPRLADFACVVESACGPLGLKRGEFSFMLIAAQRSAQADSALGSPLVRSLSAYFDARPCAALEGSASQVIATLESFQGQSILGLPAPNHFKRALQRHAAGMKALGIEYEAVFVAGHTNANTFRIWSSKPLPTDEASPAVVKKFIMEPNF